MSCLAAEEEKNIMKRYSGHGDRRTFGWIAAAAVVVAVVGGGVAQAEIPDGNGEIVACFGPEGSLRVIDTDAGEICRAQEVELAWSQSTAPTCPAGTTGFVGVCIETESRPAENFPSALDTCAAEQRRLTTHAELAGFRKIDGITLDVTGEWTADVATLTPTLLIVSLTDDRTIYNDGLTLDKKFRCVTGPEGS